MNTPANICPLFFAIVICANVVAHADDPRSAKTQWRPPSTQDELPPIKWWPIEHTRNHFQLGGAIGQHYTFETAWAYYAKLLSLDPRYNADNKEQKRSVADHSHTITEHSYDAIFRSGRWARMNGHVKGIRVHVSLFHEPGKDERNQVYVMMSFKRLAED